MRSIAPNAPFEPVSIRGESVTIETRGKILVLPTGHPYLLPSYNEYCIGRTPLVSGTYTFTNDYDSELGILNLNKNWIAICDTDDSNVDFFLFTYKPTKLKCTVDSFGIITRLMLYPGNGLIYHGRITYSDLTRDYNSDLIPDVFDSDVIGSIPRFLQSYSTINGTPGSKQFLTSDGNEFLTSNGSYFFVRA